ncbi:MAG TPA: endolytic transglycosylase MltG, partial [Streptosporangiaceae bacterium]
PQVPPAPQAPEAPPASRAPQAPPSRPARRPSQGPPGQQVPQNPQAPSVWAPSAGRPRPGFVPGGDPYQPPAAGGNGRGSRNSNSNGNGARDDTVAYDRPAGWSGRRGADRGPDPDDYIDPYGDRDSYASRRDPYTDQDGYAQRPDPYEDRDGYTDRGDAYADRDSYGGRRRPEPPSAPNAPAHDYDFPETDDYAQHVAGPGHAAAQSGPGQAPTGRTRRRERHQQHQEPVPEAAAAPPWDEEDGYEEDDRFVPGLGGPRDEDDYDDDNDDQTGRGGRGGRTSGRGGGGSSGKRRRRWLVPLVIILVILLLPLGAGGWYAYKFVQGRYYPADYAGAGTGQAVVQVQTGQTATAVGQRLVKLGVVASLRAFELAAEHSTSRHSLEPGTYRMKKQMKATLAYTLLVNQTTRIQDKITIPEGLRVSQIVAQLGAHSGIPLADYQDALKQPGALGLPSYAGGKVEGYLFPATYEVQPNQTASDVLKGMVDRYNQEATNDNLTQQAAGVKLSPGKVMVVASLIQAEGGSTTYYQQIARVIYNRLGKGMKLQLDSTVMYGLNTYGIIASNAQLQSTSPYNTYKYTGLPPGPIDNPGHAAIEAALHPGSGNNLYFVTTNPKTGLTKFTSSESQFEQFRQELEHNLGK